MEKLFINGAWVEALNGTVADLIDPSTEETVTTLSFGGEPDAIAAIEAARAAFPDWSRSTPYARAAVLKKTAQLIRERVDALAADMVRESGKPIAEARGEWNVAANLFEWYAEEGKRAYGRTIPTNRVDKRSSVIYQPLGVIGVITAWNFPAYNPARAWAAALAAGCTVVAKPAETTPLSAIRMVEALADAGLPKGVLNLLIGEAEPIGEAMLNHPALRKISFTGSTRVGEWLMDRASRTHTRLSLELGGNAPVLIFDDVDVDAIAKAAAIARFRNNGQVCIAPQRFLVQQAIYEQFTRLVTGYVSTLKVGSGFDESVQVGPLITRRQRDSILRLLEQAGSEKGTILTGGNRLPGNGFFIQPAVVACADAGSVLAKTEIFGPILPLFPFADMEEAIRLANATPYGLAAYVFTNNLRTAIEASERLEFGMVGINEWAPHGTESPFGGWKHSGQGHESGPEGLHEYLEKKLISIGGLNF